MLPNPSPSTVMNKIAVIRRYLLLSGGDTKGINSIWVLNSLDAIKRIKHYHPNVKKAIGIKDFRHIVLSQKDNFIGNSIKAMLLLIYFGAFRQSEVAPHTIQSFHKSTNMCKRDIKFKNGAMYIDLRWAKNQQRWNQQRQLKISWLSDNRLCPVAAMHRVLSQV